MSRSNYPPVIEAGHQRIIDILEGVYGEGGAGGGSEAASRVSSLTTTPLTTGTIIETVGIPAYIDDVSKFTEYGLTLTGWYVFARIMARDGGAVSSTTRVIGTDGYIALPGSNHIDVAVRFAVAAMSKQVVIDWGSYADNFIFKATDLAVRNLDYLDTFYVYDAAGAVTWEYGHDTGTAFTTDKRYFVKQNGEYVKAEIAEGETYPTKYYVEATVYVLTTDTEFADGTTYYTKDGDVYTPAEVTVGETVPGYTYYVQTQGYVQTDDETFVEGVTYYTLTEDVYTPAEVTVGETVPGYYVHTKCTIEGLPRNVTYRLDELVDCPMEFILPNVEDETHGCWFEIRCRHAGAYSMTLTPPSSDIKIATEHTQEETAGINMINLHYTVVDGVKIWRFMNTHSSIPA